MSSRVLPRLVGQDRLNAPDLAVLQSHLDAAGVVGGGGQEVSYHPDGSLSGALILLEDDFHAHPLADVVSSSTVHSSLPLLMGTHWNNRARAPVEVRESSTK
jgi:hypothetical protein